MWKMLMSKSLSSYRPVASGGRSKEGQDLRRVVENSDNAHVARNIALGFLFSFLTSVALGADEGEVVVENAIVKTIREANIPARVAGVVEDITVTEGRRVEAGEVLAKIDDHQARFELKRRQIEVSNAKMTFDSGYEIRDAELAAAVANTEYQRVLEANERHPDTYRAAEVERYKLQADRSMVAVEKATHDKQQRKFDETLANNEADAAQELLNHYVVKAPWPGTIVAVEAVAGEWVDAGAPIARVIDATRLRVEGFVSSDWTIDSLLGKPARIRFQPRTGDPIEMIGEVVFVSPDVNPVNYQAKVFIEVENLQSRLRPGWKVDVNVLLNDSSTTSIQQAQDKTAIGTPPSSAASPKSVRRD